MISQKYTVSRFFRGPNGFTCSERVYMRAVNLDKAKHDADRVRGGYVCKHGSNVPVYTGAWLLK